jgi:K+-sensing histidine kinase KdpD
MVELNSPGGNIRIEAAIKRGAPPRRLCYGSAIISVALATLVCLLLDHFLPRHPYYLWFVLAFLFTAWYGGRGPAVFNLVLAPASLAFFVLDPPDHAQGAIQVDDTTAVILKVEPSYPPCNDAKNAFQIGFRP